MLVKTDLESRIDQLDTDLKAEIKGVRADLRVGLKDVQVSLLRFVWTAVGTLGAVGILLQFFSMRIGRSGI